MFGLRRTFEGDAEAKQPGFIKGAALFTTKETQANIDRLEKESKEMARGFEQPKREKSVGGASAQQSENRGMMKGGSLLSAGSSVNTATLSRPNLGALERRTKGRMN